MEFGRRVVALRARAKIKSASELARLATIKQSSMWSIEHGDTALDEIKTGTFMRLAKALKTNPTYLYTGAGPDGPSLDPVVLALAAAIADMPEAERAIIVRLFHAEPVADASHKPTHRARQR